MMPGKQAREYARKVQEEYGLVCPHCETVLTFLFRGIIPESLLKTLRNKMRSGDARLEALEEFEQGIREGNIEPSNLDLLSPGDKKRH